MNHSVPTSENTGDNGISVIIPCYEDGRRAREASRRILAQALPDGFEVEAIIVDDGSRVDIPAMHPGNSTRARIVALPDNVGRAAARNAGARLARYPYLVFMDCDCVPEGDGFLASHLAELRKGAVAVTGRVSGTGSGFWHKYQLAASARRQGQFASGVICAGSSQNMSVDRHAFDSVGGFDPVYRGYGFEDRDLMIRISKHGRIAWAMDAEVRHLDGLTLSSVARKMYEVGFDSGKLFSERHPAAYRMLGYAAIDARIHRWLTPIGWAGGILATGVAALVDRFRILDKAPFRLAGVLTKITSALAYAAGTARRGNRPVA